MLLLFLNFLPPPRSLMRMHWSFYMRGAGSASLRFGNFLKMVLIPSSWQKLSHSFQGFRADPSWRLNRKRLLKRLLLTHRPPLMVLQEGPRISRRTQERMTHKRYLLQVFRNRPPLTHSPKTPLMTITFLHQKPPT
eukprot:Lithocolla_globosa_v1_NODE_106_length_6331_cov_39.598311.p6 type:complete len:136 gc:universal NODE_106_length_6331_cov_39.598311:2403-2810(+)